MIDITVITPVYNGENYLLETMSSVFSNIGDNPSIEYIVIDDGSTDSTLDIIDNFAHFSNLAFYSIPNGGEAAAVNFALSKSNGNFVLIVNADDPLLSPRIFSESMRLFRENPEAVVVYPDWQVISNTGEVVEVKKLPKFSEMRLIGEFWCLPGPGAVFRREAALGIGGRSAKYKFVSDYDFWLRLSRVGLFIHLPEILAQWRTHDNSTSIRSRGLEMGMERIEVMEHFLADFEVNKEIMRSAISSSYYNAALLSYFSKEIPGRKWIIKAILSNRGRIPRADYRIVIYCLFTPLSRFLIPILNRTPFINNPIKRRS